VASFVKKLARLQCPMRLSFLLLASDSSGATQWLRLLHYAERQPRSRPSKSQHVQGSTESACHFKPAITWNIGGDWTPAMICGPGLAAGYLRKFPINPQPLAHLLSRLSPDDR
jgi:hypothetical protein